MKTLRNQLFVVMFMAVTAICGCGGSSDTPVTPVVEPVINVYQWKNVMRETIGNHVNGIVVSGSNIIAGTNQGLFISADNGANWTKTKSLESYPAGLIISGTAVVAYTNQGIFVSDDNGKSWSNSTGLPSDISVQSLMVSGSNIIALIRDKNTAYYSFFTSADNGKTWKESMVLPSTTFGYSDIAINGSYVFAKMLDSGLFLSADSGETWKEVTKPPLEIRGNSFTVSGSKLIVGTNQGILISEDDGASWNNAIGVPSNTIVSALIISGLNIIADTSWGIFISDDNGVSWKQKDVLPYGNVSCTVSESDVIAICYSPERFFISSDNGENWQEVTGFSDNKLHILSKVISCDFPNLMKTVFFSVVFYYTAVRVFRIG